MGCETHILIVDGNPLLLDRAQQQLAHLERCWTRFNPDSDLSRINTAKGQPVNVDPSTITLLTAMVNGWAATSGAFDPTLLAALVNLGYRTSWTDPAAATSISEHTLQQTSPTAILLDVAASVVQAPAGIGLDAGGIGKGLAADMTVALLLEQGAAGALVSVGGDIAVRGSAPQLDGWIIGVADSRDDRFERCQIRLVEGGVATSGTAQRRWLNPAGNDVHHLLDPSTGTNTATTPQLAETTVIAGTAAWADIWTKAIMVRGAANTFTHLDHLNVAASCVDVDGTVTSNATWSLFATRNDGKNR